MGYKGIKNWHKGERPREMLLKHGANTLSEAQLLAIILRVGRGGKSAFDRAIEILKFFSNLKEIENASLGEFAPFKGMGKVKVVQLKAALELGKRPIAEPSRKGPAFSSSHEVYSYYYRHFKNLGKEIFLCVMLDAKIEY